MDGVCSKHGEEENVQGVKNLKQRDNLENLGVDESIILKLILRK